MTSVDGSEPRAERLGTSLCFKDVEQHVIDNLHGERPWVPQTSLGKKRTGGGPGEGQRPAHAGTGPAAQDVEAAPADIAGSTSFESLLRALHEEHELQLRKLRTQLLSSPWDCAQQASSPVDVYVDTDDLHNESKLHQLIVVNGRGSATQSDWEEFNGNTERSPPSEADLWRTSGRSSQFSAPARLQSSDGLKSPFWSGSEKARDGYGRNSDRHPDVGEPVNVSRVMKLINKGALQTDSTMSELALPLSAKYRHFVEGNNFELMSVIVILVNTLVMALELQYTGLLIGQTTGVAAGSLIDEQFPGEDVVFNPLEAFFTALFTVELLMRMTVRGWRGCLQFIRVPMHWLDIVVVVASIMSVVVMYFDGPEPGNTQMFRLARLFKFARGLRLANMGVVMGSLHLIVKALNASVSIMGWSLMLLVLIQCIAAMAIAQLAQPYLEDAANSGEGRQVVYNYYGTFTRSVVTMFEVTLGNWGPPCRVLMDNIGEVYSVFFLVYRCFVGFAILNVVTAVFVQQTTKVAQADQEVVLMAQHKEKQAYLSKLYRFFETADTSGDGYISHEEFLEMLARPEVGPWLSSLEIKASDAEVLFALIDDGDGQISIDEFIFGVSRMRGEARSIDVVEILKRITKIEDKLAEATHPEHGHTGHRRLRTAAIFGIGDLELREHLQQ